MTKIHRTRRRPARQRACGKRRFRDKTEALNALRKIAGRSRRDKVVKRAYECETCGGWHLTSRVKP